MQKVEMESSTILKSNTETDERSLQFNRKREKERDLKPELRGSSGQWARCVTLVSLSAGDNTVFSTGGD